MSIVGAMNKPKYAQNVIRAGDIGANAPYTWLSSEGGTNIRLPLPLNLSSSMGADWQQEGVGIIKSTLMHNKKFGEDLMAARSIKDIYSVFDSRIGSGLDAGNEDVQQLYSRMKNQKSKIGGARIASNPRNEMLFNSMPFKSYNFVFNLVPLRKEDSDAIQEAIKKIQLASAPEMRFEKMFLEYPDWWTIKFMSAYEEANEYLMKINECVCTGINVNYTPNGDSTNMHEKNAPISVELSLDFTEAFIPTKETINDDFYG